MAGRGLNSKSMSIVAMTGIYFVALFVGWFVLVQMPDAALWYKVLLADIAATVFIWATAVLLDNTSVYDPYWSLAPLPIAAYAVAESNFDTRVCIAAFCVLLWGLRLTWNFLRGWPGFGHEDWRYVAYRRFGTLGYWALSLTGLMLMPTILVYLAMTPLLEASEIGGSLGVLDLLGVVVALGFLGIETMADEQLRAFRASKPPTEAILDTGLWSWSRHPNYLGELGFWWGIACFGLSVGAAWTAWGAIAITLLFMFISVPLIDKRMHERRPAYAEHCKKVPRLFPFLPF